MKHFDLLLRGASTLIPDPATGKLRIVEADVEIERQGDKGAVRRPQKRVPARGRLGRLRLGAPQQTRDHPMFVRQTGQDHAPSGVSALLNEGCERLSRRALHREGRIAGQAVQIQSLALIKKSQCLLQRQI